MTDTADPPRPAEPSATAGGSSVPDAATAAVGSPSAAGTEAPAPAASDTVAAKRRRALVLTPTAVPGLADFRAGGERRTAFLAYWRRQWRSWAFELAMHHGLRLLPVGIASNFGAWIGRTFGPRLEPRTAEGARRNLPRVRPDWTGAAVDRAVGAHYENGGRLLVEFSALDKLMPAGRIEVVGGDALAALAARGPVVIAGCHTGNWEVMFPVFQAMGLVIADIYMPPIQHVREYIACKVRASFGAELLPPGKPGARAAIRVLERGGAVVIFCDETVDGRVMAPFFDRPPHLDGNLAIAARMKRMTGARMALYNCTRLDGARFRVTFEAPLDLPSDRDPTAPLIDDVVALNAAIEPIVRAHADQWFFLDNRFE